MSIYNPPTFSEYLSVFNPANWIPPATGGIDTVFLNANYAQYPVIQGTSYTLKNTTVSGSLNVNNANNKIIFTDSGSSGVINITNASNTNPSLLNTVAIGKNTIQGTNSATNSTVAIGYQALKTSGGGYAETNNTAVGASSLLSQSNTDNLTNQNSGFGASSLYALATGRRNSALGFSAGGGSATHQSGDNCTYLGALSGTDSTTRNYSTAVGAGAIISDDHQIQLGTGAEYVSVPNYIKFGDGTIQSTALPDQVLGAFPNVFVSSNASNYDAGQSIKNANFFFTSSNANSPTLSLPPINGVALDTTTLNIYNTGTQANPIIVKGGQTGQTQRNFFGKYGTTTSLLPVPANSWVSIRGNTAGGNFLVVDRGNVYPSEYFARSTSVDLVRVPLTNSIIRIEPTSPISAYIPDSALTTVNIGQIFTVENISNTYSIDLRLVEDDVFTPSQSATFQGLYGNDSNVLTLPPLSTYTIYVNIATDDFDVINRTPNIQTYNITSGGSQFLTGGEYYDTNINITGSTATNLEIPDARKANSQNALNRTITVNNNSSGLISLSAYGSTTFQGRYGNRASVITLPDNSSYTLTSNGTNWQINARSPNVVFRSLSIGATANFVNNFNFLDSFLYLASTVASTITWLDATALNSRLTTTKIYNTGAFQITLNATISQNGTFIGKYGSGGSALILPANTWVELFSDGTNWLVNDRSDNPIFYITSFAGATDTTTLLANYQYADSELHLSSSITTANTTVSFPNANASQTISQTYTIYNDNNLVNSNARSIILSCTTSTFRGIGVNNGTPSLTLIIIPNQWVKITSNGTNWVVVGQSPLAGQGYSSGNTITIPRPFSKFYYFNGSTSANTIITIPQAQKEDVGTDIMIKLGIRIGAYACNLYYNGASGTNPIFSALAVQPNLTGGNTSFGSGNSLRMICFQVGYAGSGNVNVLQNSATITITSVSGGGVLTHNQVITIGGVNYNIVIPNVASGPTGNGNTGTYTITPAYAGADATNVAYTINDIYGWFVSTS